MHRLAIRNAPWPRRILALAGLASIASGLVLLPAAPESLAVTHGHSGGSGSQVTVTGPRLVNPATINSTTGAAKLLKNRSSVTVSQTRNLIEQTIRVSWKNFSPTTAGTFPYSSTNTDYPVVVAECKVAHPKFEKQCFGVEGRSGTPGGENQFGPYNAVYTTTTAKGTGVADIPLLTELQNQFLGCSPTHECSLAIIPVQGGDITRKPFSCTNHLEDPIFGGNTATAGVTFGAPVPGAPECSWAKRIVVPLHFAPSLANCKFKSAAITIIGSPMAQREMDQWDTGLCEQSNPLYISYSFSLPEPAAIQAVQSGEGDVALTTRPAATLNGPHHKYTYAPISVSAVAVPYWVDNTNSGDPFTRLKLDPRLVAKMLTTSYNLSGSACTPHATKNCDPAVDGNPEDIIADPEFKKLNPGINVLDTSLGNASIANDVPIVQSGPSDMTYMVTRWIAANKPADDFLRGIPDQWGMRINSYYDNVKYPTDAFVPQDPSTVVQHAYSPVFPLALADTDMVNAWPPGTGYLKQVCGTTGGQLSYCRLAQEVPGNRVLFGVLDYADTSAFLIPSAALLNPAGHYVTPSQKSMAAAVNSLVDNGNKITQEVSTTSKNPNEYPLTMVIYAMVPTSGESHAKADAIARWLRYLAGPGQHEGTAPGTLPTGYLPLTPKLRQETLTAATEVQDQSGTTSKSPSPSTSPTASSSTSPSPGSSVSPSPSSSVSFPKIGQKISTVAVRDPQTAGFLRYALPGLLIIGGLAALGGASSLLAPNSGAIAARLRRYYRTGELWRRKP
jgi:hypothetical protein